MTSLSFEVVSRQDYLQVLPFTNMNVWVIFTLNKVSKAQFINVTYLSSAEILQKPLPHIYFN